jgi:hypothetical protein
MTRPQSSPFVAAFARTRILSVSIRTLASAATRLKPTLVICVTLSFVAMTSVAIAQESLDSEASDDLNLVKPFLGETTFLILKVDPKRIELPADTKALDAMSPEAKAAYAEASKKIDATLKQLRTLADDQPILATAGIPISKTRMPVYCFRRKTSDQNTEDVTAFVKSELDINTHLHGGYIVVMPRGGQFTAASVPTAATRTAITAAFKAVESYPVQLLIIPPEYVWRTVRELSPALPRQLGGGPSSVLTEGVQWASIGVDPQRLRMEVIVQSASDEAARALAAHLPIMLRSVHEAAEPIHRQVPAKLAKLVIDALKPQVDGSQVKIRVDGFEQNKANLALLAGILRSVEAGNRQHSNQQRFRQILLGMHNYHDVHQMLPPADKYLNKDGKHHLSWRVHILPYIGQQPLYEQFHLDEAWDSQHNKKLIEEMPDVYARRSLDPSADKLKRGLTTFLAPVGKQTIFGGANATRFHKITDGTSVTVTLLEVTPEKSVPWTAPADFSFDPQNPLAGVLIGTDGKWLCAFADGSAQQLRGNIPAKSALQLFQMNDGNPVNIEQLR